MCTISLEFDTLVGAGSFLLTTPRNCGIFAKSGSFPLPVFDLPTTLLRFQEQTKSAIEITEEFFLVFLLCVLCVLCGRKKAASLLSPSASAEGVWLSPDLGAHRVRSY